MEKGFTVPPGASVVTKAVKALPNSKSAFASAKDVEALLNRLRFLKSLARQVKRGDIQGQLFRDLVRETEEELVRALPEALAGSYRAGLDQYRKGLRLIRFAQKNVKGDPKGTLIVLEEAAEYVQKNIADIPPSDFPRLWDVINRNVPGARDITDALLGSERVGASPAGGFVAGTIPGIQRLTPAGTVTPPPGAGQGLINLGAVLGLQRLRDAPFTGQ